MSLSSSRSLASRVCAAAGSICLLLAPPASRLSAQPNDERLIRELATGLFDAYRTGRREQVAPLLSARSPHYAELKAVFEQPIPAIGDNRLVSVQVQKVWVHGARASASLLLELGTNANATEARSLNATYAERLLLCVRDDAAWRVWNLGPSIQETASAFASAKSADERRQLYTTETEWVAPELWRALIASGDRLFQLGHYPKARAAYEAAGDVAAQANDTLGTAVSLRSLGNVHLYAGDHRSAREAYAKSLELARSLHALEETMRSLNGMGNLYLALGQPLTARPLYEEMLALAEGAGDRALVAIALNNLGNVEAAQGKHDAALDFYRRGQAIKEDAGDAPGVSIALYNIGNVLFGLGRFAEALQSQQRSLEIAELAKRTAGLASIHRSIAEIYGAEHDHGRAMSHYQASLTASRALSDRAGALRTLRAIGDLWLERGEPARAIEAFERALEIARSARQPQDAAAISDQIAAARALERDPGAAAASAAVAADWADAGRLKLESLRRTLRLGARPIAAGMSPGERAAERALVDRIASLRHQVAAPPAGTTDAGRATLAADLAGATDEHRQFESRLFSRYPALAWDRAAAAAAPRTERLAPSTAIVEYAMAPDGIRIFVHRQRTSTTFVRRDRAALQQSIGALRTAIERREAFESPARDLYDSLIAPVEERLHGVVSLRVVPDGPLWSVPFEALLSPRRRFVIETWSVAYLPLASAYAPATSRSGPPMLRTLASADPPADAVGRLFALFPARMFTTPAERRAEVREIEALYDPVRRVRLATLDQAGAALPASSGRAILHIASSVLLDDADPMHSVVLGPDSSSSGEGVDAAQLADGRVIADVTILSASQAPPLNDSRSGRSIVATSWAFAVAGCPTVLLSRWMVASARAIALLRDVHAGLSDDGAAGTEVADVLRQAQLSALREAPFRHPYYWAAFMVIGRRQASAPRP